jgi:hypothetical protein
VTDAGPGGGSYKPDRAARLAYEYAAAMLRHRPEGL